MNDEDDDTDIDASMPIPPDAGQAAQQAAAGHARQYATVDQEQFEAVQDLLSRVITRLNSVEAHLEQAEADIERLGEEEKRKQTEPAPWVWYPPPATSTDPPTEVRAFVEFYNHTYLGRSGSRTTPIPDCWEQHTGLAMEIATLAATWRAANIGPRANPREAQYWHHQWRPGLIDRMVRDWTHPDCHDGTHTPTGPAPRPHRFAPPEEP